jgi:hypothetical protein
MKVLLFPSTTFEAVAFASQLKSEGHVAIGAASINSELLNSYIFDENIHIPHIVDDTFIDILTVILKDSEITHFWTSVNSVYGIAKSTVLNLGIDMLSCDPMLSPLFPVELVNSEVDGRAQYLKMLRDSVGNAPIESNVLKSTIFNALSVPGQSHFDKLLTVCQMFSDIPENGDLVEIGSLWGRSANQFLMLSQVFNKGNLLCIDPWPHNGMTQDTGSKLEEYSKDLDSSSCFTIFTMKLAALFPRKINYIRDYSDNALSVYKELSGELNTAEFGNVSYSKKISLLHIDGNHGFEAVKSDVEKWCPLVIPGGWIIFDDYNWSYGEGPTTVVDNYLQTHLHRLETAFFSGGAMFVKLKN